MQRLFVLSTKLIQIYCASAPSFDQMSAPSAPPCNQISAPSAPSFNHMKGQEANNGSNVGFNSDINGCPPEYQTIMNKNPTVSPFSSSTLDVIHSNTTNIAFPTELKKLIKNPPSKNFQNETYDYNSMVDIITNIVSQMSQNMPDLGINKDKYKDYLCGRNIVIILDNSGSMSNKTDEDSFLNDMGIITNSYRISRHQEMTAILLFMLQALLKSEVESVHVEFLNPVMTQDNEMIKEIKLNFEDNSIQKLYKALVEEPCGSTPLTTTLERLIGKYGNEESTHFVVFTDGQPYSTESPRKNSVKGLKHLLKKHFSNERFYSVKKFICAYHQIDHLETKRKTINFIACTGNEQEVEYLNNIDDKSINIDITSDYNTEIAQIKAHLGQRSAALESFPKRMSVYIYKALVGSLDLGVDKLDKKKQ